MTPEVNLSVPGLVPPPTTVSMTTIDLLHQVGPDGAFLECASSVEGDRIRLLHRECKSKDGTDKKRNLCAGHVTALPRGETRTS
jgi:hypothetical protein